MQTRHRIPVVFSLSMLDMLCCALGAVVFLMIVNLWDARRQSKALAIEQHRVGEAAEKLSSSQGDLEKAQSHLDSSRESVQQLRARIRTMEEESEKTKTRLADTERGLEAARKLSGEKETDSARLAAEMKSVRERLEEAEKQRDDARDAAGKVPSLQKELAESTQRAKSLEAELEKLRKQSEEAGAQLTDSQKAGESVQAEFAKLRKQLEEQQESVAQARRQLTANEGRFAGVDLGGRRIICLVDMSGSMGSLDSKTLDPKKWPEVGKTVDQVLKSLPEATHFQVIVFSTETQFLLGKPGEWLTYDREISPKAVAQALARVQPQGDTNLYAAFEAAFRYRPQGLDSIFLFSDGLPNIGPGLPTPPPKDDYVRSAMLGSYLRESIRTRWNPGEPRVRIHTIGFYYESPNLGAFLWALARENGGSFVGMSR
jgi:predicted  nucleic acid-binding Zn-ribbon protein